jgi:hypothetical protein
MSHLGIIQSYPGGNADFRYLWPWTKRHAGFDRVLVTGPHGTWHPPEAEFFQCGRDAYVDGDNLPRKLVDSIDSGLRMFPQATWITCEEYDCWHPRDFVRSVPDGVMCGIRVGGQIAGCDSHWFAHWPVSATRATWERWLPQAKLLLAQGRIEKGTPDAFLALACEVAHIPPKFDCWRGFSRNTIHGFNPANPQQGDFLPAARAAYMDGCQVYHGVKTSKAYACDVATTVREITRP